jgi:hypothetical protein
MMMDDATYREVGEEFKRELFQAEGIVCIKAQY